MNSDLEHLLRAASYTAEIAPSLQAAARAMGDATETQEPARTAGATEAVLERGISPVLSNRTSMGSSDTGTLAAEVSRLTEATRAAAAVNAATPRATTASGSTTPEDSSFADTAFRTAAMMTGVGPIVTGLMKLFGSNDSEAPPPLEKFIAPASISVDAALTASRDFGAVRYAQGGTPGVSPGTVSQSSAATIQVNIQALDSQSFLDRQDDIARAVREAMLHSNSLNDVVMEL